MYHPYYSNCATVRHELLETDHAMRIIAEEFRAGILSKHEAIMELRGVGCYEAEIREVLQG